MQFLTFHKGQARGHSCLTVLLITKLKPVIGLRGRKSRTETNDRHVHGECGQPRTWRSGVHLDGIVLVGLSVFVLWFLLKFHLYSCSLALCKRCLVNTIVSVIKILHSGWRWPWRAMDGHRWLERAGAISAVMVHCWLMSSCQR